MVDEPDLELVVQQPPERLFSSVEILAVRARREVEVAGRESALIGAGERVRQDGHPSILPYQHMLMATMTGHVNGLERPDEVTVAVELIDVGRHLRVAADREIHRGIVGVDNGVQAADVVTVGVRDRNQLHRQAGVRYAVEQRVGGIRGTGIDEHPAVGSVEQEGAVPAAVRLGARNVVDTLEQFLGHTGDVDGDWDRRMGAGPPGVFKAAASVVRDMTGRPLDVLEETLGEEVRVTLKGGEAFEGTLAGYDQHMNLVIEADPDNTTIIRGDNVVSIEP